MLSALTKGDIKIIKKFYNQNRGWFDLPLDNKKYTALHIAVATGNFELIRILVEEYKVDLNQRVDNPASLENGATAVYLASNLQNISDDVLQYLVIQGADVGIATNNGRTPLSAAAYNNRPERIGIISKADNPNPNQVTTKNYYSALIHAVENSSADAVNYILMVSGIDVNHQRKNGDSAICIATKNGAVDKVKLLLSAYTESNAIQSEAYALSLKKALVIADKKGYRDIAYKLAKIYLPIYVYNAKQRPKRHYKTRIPFFGIGLGYSSDQKLAASCALDIEVNHDYGHEKNTLSEFKGELSNGELGLIRRSLQIKL